MLCGDGHGDPAPWMKRPRLPIFAVMRGGHCTTYVCRDRTALLWPVRQQRRNSSEGRRHGGGSGGGNGGTTIAKSDGDRRGGGRGGAVAPAKVKPQAFTFTVLDGLDPRRHVTRIGPARLGSSGGSDGQSGTASSAAEEEDDDDETRREANQVADIVMEKRQESGRLFYVMCRPGSALDAIPPPSPATAAAAAEVAPETASERTTTGTDALAPLPPAPPSLPPPTERWYCRSCWLGEPLRVYAYNDAGAGACKVCARPALSAGWGHWVRDLEVPRRLLRNWDRDRAPPEVQVLRTRWPDLELLL